MLISEVIYSLEFTGTMYRSVALVISNTDLQNFNGQ